MARFTCKSRAKTEASAQDKRIEEQRERLAYMKISEGKWKREMNPKTSQGRESIKRSIAFLFTECLNLCCAHDSFLRPYFMQEQVCL